MSNKDEIKEAVKNYYIQSIDKPKGEKIQYAGHIFDEKELISATECVLSTWLAGGKYTEKFEKMLGEFLGQKYVSFVNSGSSANLCAFMALTSRELGERRVKRGDEIITVAVGFPTTISPIIQYGAVPVFVDVTIPQYNIDISMLERALSDKTKAIMIAHSFGNPFNLDAVKRFCDEHNLWLIEDNCDALGAKYKINGQYEYTGTVGDIGTSSFYPAHHITTGEGGAVYTNNPLLHKLIRSMRDWGRDCICPPGVDNYCGSRFDGQYGSLPAGYDHKYVYSHFGYNLKASDMQAAVGVEQMKKLPIFIEKRNENFRLLNESLADLQDKLILPEACEESIPSWFAYVITVKESIERSKITRYLEEHKIQTRLFFAGNILRHPCFEDLRADADYIVVGELKNSDIITEKTFLVGVYPGISDKEIEFISGCIHDVLAD